MTLETHPLQDIGLRFNEVFADGNDEVFYRSGEWKHPVSYFVGRNGSGKSRAARLVAQGLGGTYLSTDRLAGLMNFSNYGWTAVPEMQSYRGLPLSADDRRTAETLATHSGSGVGSLYALKDQPEVWLRVAAFLRRALGRTVELRENAGYLDPYVRVGTAEYSLLRDEGHGLRELVILLTAAYREDWTLLVVDEPELHLHPAMARLWLSELERECKRRNVRALIVTHEPTMVKPQATDDLGAVWYFSAGQPSSQILSHISEHDHKRVTSSLQRNPHLLSQLIFSPRPVLVEGIHDAAAISVALARSQPSEVVAQTDVVECGGNGSVALWFNIATSLGIDVRAIADLDSCFASEVQEVMDKNPEVVRVYREFGEEPAKSHVVLRPLIARMNTLGIPPNPKQRAEWLAKEIPEGTGWESRLRRIREAWMGAGLWLHPQGTLEDVLGIDSKGRDEAQRAASAPGEIDKVAAWSAFELDPMGDVEILLGVAVERIAHAILEALRIDPDARFTAPIGGNATSDSRLVSVTHVQPGCHRLTVKKPSEFAGYWVEFSRDTPASALILNRP